MIADPTRSLSLVSSPLSKHTPRLVSHYADILGNQTDCDTGLQTPRLKRLAEIVSAQAIAQQEKLEYPQDDSNDLTDSELNGS